MSAPKGNQYAKKPASDRASAGLYIRVKQFDKARFTKAALVRAKRDERVDTTLSSWVVDVLRAEADYELTSLPKT